MSGQAPEYLSGPKRRRDTAVTLLPRKDGRSLYPTEGVSRNWSLQDATRVSYEVGCSGEILSVIALSDGANSIRQHLHDLFGGMRGPLDWYLMSGRIRQSLSVCAYGKGNRKHEVMGYLWCGRVSEVFAFLSGLQPVSGGH